MSRLTLLLLLDAFRPDYLRDAPFLRRLAGESAVGRFREPFGFVPRAAYFGGLTPAQLGFSNMYRQADGDSPFAACRALPAAIVDAAPSPVPARAFLDGWAAASVPPYARYVSSMRVPASILPHLAPVETRAPWDPRVGYRSLFHELDAAGQRWLAAAWPDTTALADPSDAGILADVLRRIDVSHRFAFVHFQELDAAGHHHGPEAAALRAHVARTDALVARLISALTARFDAVDLLAFGDHGMVTVTTPVDVRPALASTGLVPGVDYLYFLDSTMVRLWHLTSRSRPLLREAMSRCAGLDYLDAAAQRRHRIAGCDPRNGHDIYLARPGVVVWPDFFGGSAGRPKGMHGYDPDCSDNQGIYLHWSSEGPRRAADAGIVDAPDLYPRLRSLTGLAPAAARPTAAPRRRYTSCPDPAAEARVAEDMAIVVAAVRRAAPGAEALVLTGSFGRGEGGMVRVAGGWTPLNDYDLLVVGGPDPGAALDGVAAQLRPQFGLDYLDLAWTDGAFEMWPHTMANHDLRHGSRVLWGDPDVLDRLPRYCAGDLSPHEALTLLLNRAGGVLSALGPAPGDAAAWSPAQHRYLATQVAKAMVAIGDAYLVEWGAYDPSYSRRAERFAALAPGAGVPAATIAAAGGGYARKLRPDAFEPPADPRAEVVAVAPHLLAGIVRLTRRALRVPARSVDEAVSAIGRLTGPWVAADNERLRTRPAVAALVGPAGGGGAADARSVRQAVYSTLPLLLARTWADLDGRTGAGPGTPPPFAAASWTGLRAAAVAAWLEMIH